MDFRFRNVEFIDVALGSRKNLYEQPLKKQRSATLICSIKQATEASVCGTIKSNTKIGWPNFIETVKDNLIQHKADTAWGTTLTKVMCNICDSHPGQVLPDEPEPSGLRLRNQFSVAKKRLNAEPSLYNRACKPK
jgi:peptide methionine sulfoxide reductase MsrB